MAAPISYPSKLRCQEVELYKAKELELELEPHDLIWFNKLLFSTYYVPGVLLGAGGAKAETTEFRRYRCEEKLQQIHGDRNG